jgi:hypothetical protein
MAYLDGYVDSIYSTFNKKPDPSIKQNFTNFIYADWLVSCTLRYLDSSVIHCFALIVTVGLLRFSSASIIRLRMASSVELPGQVHTVPNSFTFYDLLVVVTC